MTVRHSGVGVRGLWVLAPSLVSMEAEADRIAPNRRRTSDGSIGDAAHAARTSDHNPDEEGAVDYVDALDLSHDPDGGFDAHAYARSVARNIANGIETRIDYIISNRQIFSQRLGLWAWRPYTGTNMHTQHAHFSVKDIGRFDTSPFFAASVPFPTPDQPPIQTHPTNPVGPATKEDDIMRKIIWIDGGARLIETDGTSMFDDAPIPNLTALAWIQAAYPGIRESTMTKDKFNQMRASYKFVHIS